MFIGTILFWILAIIMASMLLAVIIDIIDDDCEVDSQVLFTFPANLIFVIKYWWKAIIKAIKSPIELKEE